MGLKVSSLSIACFILRPFLASKSSSYTVFTFGLTSSSFFLLLKKGFFSSYSSCSGFFFSGLDNFEGSSIKNYWTKSWTLQFLLESSNFSGMGSYLGLISSYSTKWNPSRFFFLTTLFLCTSWNFLYYVKTYCSC